MFLPCTGFSPVLSIAVWRASWNIAIKSKVLAFFVSLPEKKIKSGIVSISTAETWHHLSHKHRMNEWINQSVIDRHPLSVIRLSFGCVPRSLTILNMLSRQDRTGRQRLRLIWSNYSDTTQPVGNQWPQRGLNPWLKAVRKSSTWCHNPAHYNKMKDIEYLWLQLQAEFLPSCAVYKRNYHAHHRLGALPLLR